MTITLSKIKSIHWYRQGGAARPLYVSYPITASAVFYLKNKPTVYFFKNIMISIYDDQTVWYICKPELKKIVQFYLQSQIKHKNFIADAKKHWDKYNVQPFLSLVHNLEYKNFDEFSNAELLQTFNNFSEIFMSLWYNSIFHDTFDVAGEKILLQTLKQEKLVLTDLELSLLLSNPTPSPLQQERLDLLKITEQILKLWLKPNQLNIKFLKNKFSLIYQKLGEHSRKYHWSHNDYASIQQLDARYFLHNIKILIQDQRKLKLEQDLKNSFVKIKHQRDKLIKNRKISRDCLNIINLLLVISCWRDERKMYNQMGDGIIHHFIKELSLRTDIAEIFLEHLLWSEIKNVFNLSVADLQAISQRREQGMFCVIPRRYKIEWLDYKQIRKINSIMKNIFAESKQLEGSPAYPGKVQSIARIILNKKDFHKLKPGEILVAPNTRPEYVPIMKIAGAIISEEGGITCHAAIISRELKKPTIVGVQGALDVLKDGDIVEVDADKGVVRRL
ncbi:hypothetical protein AUJ29_02305 [Candidatus Kuenenbacteria bacterium CG1_02_38_13]|uniref:PEP-utilising enzyme mobile domain-containing protein n=1 Tax=Candidatus Kuenenbacteria bacterium CG1_02_38_13 TaxID=1805235 RepID=A0A1J4TXN3_9BACT|nr:MAG: hypothetical protein AUJ29_02305 [Candidatus Kuenenbacteria bacterium CG1_02_38_13]